MLPTRPSPSSHSAPLLPPNRGAARLASVALSALALLGPPDVRPAAAYEPSTTLAGLTEQAALASRLHRRLVDRFGASMGLFEPLRLDLSQLPPVLARSLHSRLSGLDPAAGYAPDSLSRLPGQSLPSMRVHALGWLAAGSVIEGTPAWRARHHFFDPASGRGLHRPGDVSPVNASLESVRTGMSSVRQLLAGAAVDGTGLPAPEWLESADNELGQGTLLAAYEQAVAAETAVAREGALARVLLSAGAMAAVLAQQGDPAYVRNDLAGALEGSYARYAAERYGRAGVPAPAAEALLMPPSPTRLRDLFSDGAGHGLAERTAARFYSPGALPDVESKLAQIPAGRSGGYLAAPPLRHAVAWTRQGELPHLFLDERCHADYAAVLLPETARFVQVLLDFLLRAELRLAPAAGGKELQVRVAEVQLGSGTLSLFAEGADGRRRLVRTTQVLPTRPGATLATLSLDELGDKEAQRLIVLYRGRDLSNEPLIASAELSLARPE